MSEIIFPSMVRNMPADEYHAVDAVSSSFLKTACTRTLAHARARQMEHVAQTPQMAVGSALHCLVLEPTKFAERYYECEHPGNRKDGIAERAAASKLNPRVEFLNREQAASVRGMEAALQSHKSAIELLNAEGESEVSLFWMQDGLPCKARIDRYPTKLPYVVDLKTTQDAGQQAWINDSIGRHGYGYHFQQAWYESGLAAIGVTDRKFVFVLVESSSPFGVVVAEFDRLIIESAWNNISRVLPDIADARVSGKYPSYPDTIRHTFAPSWMAGEIGEVN